MDLPAFLARMGSRLLVVAEAATADSGPAAAGECAWGVRDCGQWARCCGRLCLGGPRLRTAGPLLRAQDGPAGLVLCRWHPERDLVT